MGSDNLLCWLLVCSNPTIDVIFRTLKHLNELNTTRHVSPLMVLVTWRSDIVTSGVFFICLCATVGPPAHLYQDTCRLDSHCEDEQCCSSIRFYFYFVLFQIWKETSFSYMWWVSYAVLWTTWRILLCHLSRELLDVLTKPYEYITCHLKSVKYYCLWYCKHTVL
jgi:hypothetical protein